jgi:hypothetical protein
MGSGGLLTSNFHGDPMLTTREANLLTWRPLRHKMLAPNLPRSLDDELQLGDLLVVR